MIRSIIVSLLEYCGHLHVCHCEPDRREGVAISAFHEALRLLSRVLRGTALLAMTEATGGSVEELG
jgi:hypothetical protein